MKKMTVTISVNAAQAVREGNTVVGDVQLTLEPSDLEKLTPAQRETLAKHFAGEKYYAERLNDIVVGRADIETLGRLLDAKEAEAKNRRQVHAELQARVDERNEAELAELRAELASPTAKMRVGLAASGELIGDNSYGDPAAVWAEVTVPANIQLSGMLSSPRPSEEHQAEYARLRRQRDAAISAAKEAALPALREKWALWKREEEAAEAATKAEYDALYARLPETMRQRHAAGYATDKEVRKAIRGIMRDDAGLDNFYEHGQQHTELSTLTDDEFLALEKIKKDAPAGSTVEPVELYIREYRDARDDDDPSDIDDDGEVLERSEDFGHFARIEWSLGGIDCVAHVRLA